MMEGMASAGEDDVSIHSVRARLAAGSHPVEVFTTMVDDGAAPRQAAVIICIAAGTRRRDAEQRLTAFDDLWEAMHAGDEHDVATLLHMHGYFDPDAVLDDAEVAIATQMYAALDLVDGVPSGHAISLYRNLRTGRLADAFLQLERLGTSRWATNRHYWAALSRAGDRLPPDRDDVAAAQQRCRERLFNLFRD